MAGNLLNTYITGFDRAIRETVETKGGKMRQYVQVATGDLFRKEGVYQRTTGGGLPQKVTNRFGDSPVSDIDYSRRRTSRTAFQDGQFMDWADLSKMGVDPRAAKLQVMKNKFLRQEDLTIDAAALGDAKGGVEGDETVNFGEFPFIADGDAGNGADKNIVDVTTTADGATGDDAEGFTYGKFLEALAQFGRNSVDIETQKPLFKISWNQWQDIMNDDNFTDFDNRGGAKVNESGAGQIYDYMGASFCISNIVPFMGDDSDSYVASDIKVDTSADVDASTGVWTAASNTRCCYAMIQDAVLFEVNPDMTTKISERADKGFNYYAYMKAEFGAVRMEEEKVIAIACAQ